MLERILVGAIVLFCLVYTIRKIVAILRGKEGDGCAFCSGGHADAKGSTPCAGCMHRDSCTSKEKDCDKANP